MTPPPLTDTLQETLALFEEGGAPLTTMEVAERVDCGRRSAYERLERLVDHGRLETKSVGGNGRVWWQPPTDGPAVTRNQRERDDQFQTLVDATDEYAIFMLDPDGRVRTWNPGAERIKGYEREEIVGEHFSAFYTDDDRSAGIPERNLSAAARDGSFEDDGWRVRADGSEFWATVTISAIRTDNGEIDGFAKVTRDMTDRKEYERRLEAQAERLKSQRDELESELDSVFERIADGFYALDEDLRFRYLNDHATDILGLNEPAVGSDIRDVVVLTEPFENALYEALETQSAVIFEDYYEPVQGWFSNAIYPSESGLSVYFREISDQKRRDRELEQYERIVETIDDGIYVLDSDRRFTMVNSAFVSMTMYEREDLLGATATTVFGEKFVDIANEKQAALESGQVDIAVLEEALYRSDGTSFVVESRFDLFDVDGEVGRVGVVRDITDRAERERKLEESERRYRTLVEHFPNGAVGLFDEDLRYTALGGELVDAVGVSPEERVGNSVYEIYPEDLLEEIEPHFEAALNGELHSFEIEYHDRHLLAHTVPVKDATNGVFAGMVVVQDVTERREYRRRLEESNERLEQFAYAASHDLQEPLRMVTSYLQLIDRRYGEALDEDGSEFIEYAVDGAERMRAMIDGLLEYSRVDTRGDPFEPVDLALVFEAVCEDLQVRIEESDAEITADSLPHVIGDVSQLRQLFQNLLNNAIEYSDDEPPRVHITAERDGGHWLISVHDEGVGIDPNEQERIFEVFQRLHTYEEHPGTGIGLALCRRIVERHGGEIRVDSETGEGSTFSITLPAADT